MSTRQRGPYELSQVLLLSFGLAIWMACFTGCTQKDQGPQPKSPQGAAPPVPTDIGEQTVIVLDRDQLPAGVKAIEGAYPGWEVLAVKLSDTRVGIATDDDVPLLTIVVHPVGKSNPAVLQWKGHIGNDQPFALSFDAANHLPSKNAANVGLQVYVNDKMIDQQVIGPCGAGESPWKSFKYSLSDYAGQDVTVQIRAVTCGDWYYEFMNIANLRIGAPEEGGV